MKEYRITTQNIDYGQENDCVIDENDPINLIKKSLLLGGLGMEPLKLNSELLSKYWPKKD
jgi:hypothetical protein